MIKRRWGQYSVTKARGERERERERLVRREKREERREREERKREERREKREERRERERERERERRDRERLRERENKKEQRNDSVDDSHEKPSPSQACKRHRKSRADKLERHSLRGRVLPPFPFCRRGWAVVTSRWFFCKPRFRAVSEGGVAPSVKRS